MLNEQLQKKVDRALKLLQSVAPTDGSPVEVAYSGGKDSDVILQLAKESGIKYRAIYKNTTIDPPGTIAHVKKMNVDIMPAKKSFFEIVAEAGFPNMFNRFCCKYLKEYKVLDKCIMGVRKAESNKRNARYNEPTECKWYGAKKEENHVEAIYPILNWTDQDVHDFIVDRNITLAPRYYDWGGQLHTERRLGCMCCPLQGKKMRINSFKEYPRMVKAYLRAGQKYRERHPNAVQTKRYIDVYEWFTRDVFFDNQQKFETIANGMFGKPDYKAFLEQQFGIDLTINQNK